MTTSADRRVELVVDAHATVGEGPVWDAARRVLWWVDIPAGAVHRFDPSDGSDEMLDAGSPVGAVALRRDGSLLAATAERLAVLDPEDGRRDPLFEFAASEPPLRCNDGTCDPAGRFWIGRMAFDAAPGVGALLRVDGDGTVTTRLEGLTIPNGLGWSADGRRMYFLDSVWGEVREYAYDPQTGAMGEGRTFVRFPDDGSVPDGLTIDADGHLWVARWGASCVVRVAPDGSLVDRIDLPVSQVSSCSFGGDDLGDLYITTAHEDFGPEDLAREPLAGGLFRVRPGVRGFQPVPFAG